MSKAVFLDLDGTLIDPKSGITSSIQHALTAIGIDPPHADALEWCIGPPLLDSLAKLGAPDPDLALQHYREVYEAGRITDARVYPRIPDTLKALDAAGHRLFLATAKPHVFARMITAHFGLDLHLEAQYGPETDGARNDKGDLLRHALSQRGIAPENAVMVGDRGSDLTAARAAGMPFVGVTWGFAQPGEMDGADALAHHAEDIPRAVEALGG
ncbi:Phosphoglycolate phosphatase [Candidatus Rhodobacter oscarellae]|uniref:Phosphoglycolate phosphatase n=1 Tax=Candidatus Rhodobacter oscarellae TaxID=1675527 RepID=A0A0J9ECY1_9RHOB|nr:HAD hydrolase-like protein [Candidatus Rhodobacter lobularis]KMW60632.1 Phosphoglycolate phosphatase [Candidatus Rhodobacter lobularis]